MAHFERCTAMTGLALGAALVVGGCTNMEKMPKPEAGTKPVACTMEYAPVCAVKGKERRTFSNACMAKAEGFSVDRAGTCEG